LQQVRARGRSILQCSCPPLALRSSARPEGPRSSGHCCARPWHQQASLRSAVLLLPPLVEGWDGGFHSATSTRPFLPRSPHHRARQPSENNEPPAFTPSAPERYPKTLKD